MAIPRATDLGERLKEAAGMLARALFARPLSPAEFVTLALTLLATGTLYCVAYCRIAFPMHGHEMPLSASALWAAHSFLPWLVLFEAWKRAASGQSRAVLWPLAALALGVAASCAIALEPMLDAAMGVANTRPVPLRAAAQLPALFATIAFMAGAAVRMRAAAAVPESRDSGPTIMLPPATEIGWIEAAGNYVEIHGGARALLVRATMRQVETLVDPARFVRIHRSIIVNRDRVAGVGGAPSRPVVTMRDGSRLKVGDAYRRNVRTLGR